jgi:hypothetical protein
MTAGDLLETILRSEVPGREDPSAVALYEYVARQTDEDLVAAIVWHLTIQAEERGGWPVRIGARTRTTITNYPSIGSATAPAEFLARLLAASACDVYLWLLADLQQQPIWRDEVAPGLLAHGWIEIEIDAAQVAVVLPFDYFVHRPGMSEHEREAAVRNYALEQAMVL